MNSENVIQLLVALVAIAPGLAALIVQWRKNKAEADNEARDDNREDFTALFDAARQLGDAGTALVGPLTETIKKLRKEMEDREKEYRSELQELEIRLSAAERQIEDLITVNVKLADANQRYENFFKWLRGELSRLSRVEPGKFHGKEEGLPDYTKEP